MSKARVEGWCCCVVGIKLNPNPRVGRVLNLGEDPPESESQTPLQGLKHFCPGSVSSPTAPRVVPGFVVHFSAKHSSLLSIFIHHQRGHKTIKEKQQTILKGCLGCRMHDHAGLYICCRTPEIARPGAVPSPRWVRWVRCRVRSPGLTTGSGWMDGSADPARYARPSVVLFSSSAPLKTHLDPCVELSPIRQTEFHDQHGTWSGDLRCTHSQSYGVLSVAVMGWAGHGCRWRKDGVASVYEGGADCDSLSSATTCG